MGPDTGDEGAGPGSLAASALSSTLAGTPSPSTVAPPVTTTASASASTSTIPPMLQPLSTPPSQPSSSLPTQGASTAAAHPASNTRAFSFPHAFRFPPMYTLQPNLATRRAQLDKWCSLVLAYCRHYRIFYLVVDTVTPTRPSAASVGPVRVSEALRDGTGDMADDDSDGAPARIPYYVPDLFNNAAIDRALPPAGMRAVLDDLQRQRRIEYVDRAEPRGTASHGDNGPIACYVFWKTAEEWAAAVEAWIDETAQRGSVLTLYELTAGDATRGTDLHGLDPVVLQRALAVLVKRGKAQVFGAAESLGVKFF